MNRLPIVFMGTPALACASLQALLACDSVLIRAVVTQPDRPKGRELRLHPSPVKELAVSAGVPVLQPERVRDPGFLSELRQLGPELVCVAAFGQILPADLLELPKHGCLNVHTSLLPKYRGAAPIQWALLNGEAETGVTIMKMDRGLDTGDIVAQRSTPIAPEDTSETLHDRLARMGAELLVETIPGYVCGQLLPHSQPTAGVTLARKIKKEDGRIDWSRPARAVWNQVRALVPWPGAFTFWQADGPRLLKVWRAGVTQVHGEPGQIASAEKSGIVVGCGTDSLRIEQVQLEGGRRLSAQEFLAGHRVEAGSRFG